VQSQQQLHTQAQAQTHQQMAVQQTVVVGHWGVAVPRKQRVLGGEPEEIVCGAEGEAQVGHVPFIGFYLTHRRVSDVGTASCSLIADTQAHSVSLRECVLQIHKHTACHCVSAFCRYTSTQRVIA